MRSSLSGDHQGCAAGFIRLHVRGSPFSSIADRTVFVSGLGLCLRRPGDGSTGWTISCKKGTDSCHSKEFQFLTAGAVIPCEHGLVHRYPQQHSDEMIGGQQRVVKVQNPAIGKALKAHCQGSEYTFEALLIPTAADVGETLGVCD